MKRVISTLLMFMLVLPAFAPWIPHGAMHALHDTHVSVHHSSDHHNHHAHDHEHHHQTKAHHPFHLDFASYFKDYLHVDLKKPEPVTFDLPPSDSQGFDPLLNSAIYSTHYELAVVRSRAPPDYQRRTPDHLPLYLSTQRLRI